MKNLLLFLTLGLSVNLAEAQPKDDKQLTAEFDKMLSEQFKANETGATVLVARKGQVIYEKAFGMANLEYDIPMKVGNIFRIGSITKQFTAIAILQLMEQGKLNLQDTITKFIPDYPMQGYNITIEHLLTHTSGIQNFTGMKDYLKIEPLDLKPAEVIDHFKNQPMKFAPGTDYSYNNSGYFLLGYIIEKVSGKTYPQYVEDNFFKTLNMTHSLYGSNSKIVKNRVGAYEKDSTGIINASFVSMTIPYSAGSLQSTVGDLFKWHQAVHSYKLVKKENLEKAFTRYKLTDGKETNYGYGWFLRNIQGSPTIEHNGSGNGNSTQSIFLPKEDVFVAIFSNCDCNSTNNLGINIAAHAIGKPYEYKEIPVETAVLQDYTGVYENENDGKLFITLSENQLYYQFPNSRKNKIKAFQKDAFYTENPFITIEFTRNKKGEVAALTLKGRLPDKVWHKTNKPIPAEK